jgi:two-component system, OmpR family, response regulator
MRILLAEDESRIALSLKKGFTQEGFAVDIAEAGQKALELATTEPYDVMILDIMLPEVDGIAICKAVRAQKIATPVMLLTARSLVHQKVEGLNAGADDYVTKPFSFEELLARVRALTRRSPVLSTPLLQVGGLTLDPATHTVVRAEKHIQLSNREFGLLEYLLRHSGKVLSKDHLIAHVWDYDADVLPNTVEVFMRHLRKKVDEPFPELPPLLHTVRGVGYKLE